MKKETHKVKILKASYDSEKDIIIWNVLFLDTKEDRTLCWPSVDLASSLGITSSINKDQFNKFCEDITGKEILLVIDCLPVNNPDYKKNIDDIKNKDSIADNIHDTLMVAANKFMNDS